MANSKLRIAELTEENNHLRRIIFLLTPPPLTKVELNIADVFDRLENVAPLLLDTVDYFNDIIEQYKNHYPLITELLREYLLHSQRDLRKLTDNFDKALKEDRLHDEIVTELIQILHKGNG
jgi:hypothetical protein